MQKNIIKIRAKIKVVEKFRVVTLEIFWNFTLFRTLLWSSGYFPKLPENQLTLVSLEILGSDFVVEGRGDGVAGAGKSPQSLFLNWWSLKVPFLFIKNCVKVLIFEVWCRKPCKNYQQETTTGFELILLKKLWSEHNHKYNYLNFPFFFH